MLKRFLISLICVSVFPIGCAAQGKLAVISSVPLPEVLEGKLAQSSSPPGCGDDGSLTIYSDEGKEDVRPGIFRLSPNGNVLAHIDIQDLQGFTPHTNFDFASGPNGEIYLLLQDSYPWYDQSEHKIVVEGTASPTTELLRFSSTGDLISRTQLQPQFEASKLAVFSDGTVLLLGRAIGQGYNRGLLVARFLTGKGELSRDVVLPSELSSRHPDGRYEQPILVTMGAQDTGEVWVVRVGRAPVLLAISEKGDIRLTTKLKTPEGFRVINPRVAGDRLFTALLPVEQKAKREPEYAQFSAVTGDVVQVVLAPGPRGIWHAICNSSNGMYFINSQERTLNILALAPPK